MLAGECRRLATFCRLDGAAQQCVGRLRKHAAAAGQRGDGEYDAGLERAAEDRFFGHRRTIADAF
jgi:hypothetical protein